MRYLIFFLLLPTVLSGQSLERVRTHLQALTSAEMHGRGAEFSGDSIAAEYIAGQFKKTGLLPISDSYYQNFNYEINTFPGDLFLKAGNCVLKPGREYIAESSSRAGSGTVKLLYFDTLTFASDKIQSKFLKADVSKKAIVIDSKDLISLYSARNYPLIKKVREAQVLIQLENKLTAGLSHEQGSQVHFKVLKDSFPSSLKKIEYSVDAILKNHHSQNVIGLIKGKSKSDSIVVVSAHYDHLGRMGKQTYFPGANDNASGVSMLLELAEYYSKNQPEYSIAFMAFGAEEAGLIGSNFFVQNPLFPLDQIRFMINLDLLGTGEDGIMIVNGAVLPRYFSKFEAINKEKGYLKEIKKRGKAANSDHYFFNEAGVPAVFIYTLGGIAAYHDVYDIPQTLPLTEFVDLFRLITDFITDLPNE